MKKTITHSMGEWRDVASVRQRAAARATSRTVSLEVHPSYADFSFYGITARLEGNEARVDVAARGTSERRQASKSLVVPKQAFLDVWDTLVHAGALSIGEPRGCGRGTDMPTRTIRLEWDDEKHEFTGYDLGYEGPYEIMVEAIQSLVPQEELFRLIESVSGWEEPDLADE
jgi:hypothetical protein